MWSVRLTVIRLCLRNGRRLTNTAIWVVCSHAKLLMNVLSLILIAPNCIPIIQSPTAFRPVPARKMQSSSAVPIQMLIPKAGLVTKSIHVVNCEKLFYVFWNWIFIYPQAFFLPYQKKLRAQKKLKKSPPPKNSRAILNIKLSVLEST